MRMPFGKHRGEPVADLDEDYLSWLLTLDNLSPQLRAAVADQLGVQDREDWLDSAACVLPGVVWQWRRMMAERYGDDPASLDVVADGLRLLEQLCSGVTGGDQR